MNSILIRSASVIVLLFTVLMAPTQVWAQNRPISLLDQQRTERIIRDIDRFTAQGIRSMTNLQTNVDRLLTRQDSIGAPQSRLDGIAAHYTASVSAILSRQEARINRDANEQLRRLSGLSSSESLIQKLTEARDESLADLRATSAAAIAAIAASLRTVTLN